MNCRKGACSKAPLQVIGSALPLPCLYNTASPEHAVCCMKPRWGRAARFSPQLAHLPRLLSPVSTLQPHGALGSSLGHPLLASLCLCSLCHLPSFSIYHLAFPVCIAWLPPVESLSAHQTTTPPFSRSHSQLGALVGILPELRPSPS